ncbi:hypothetical protein KAR48_16520 [bacterium]|nr:hypothetical protein [bacterium]
MQLSGIFVEYLVIGSFSLLWLLPLLHRFGIDLPDQGSLIVVLTPSLYVIGMFVDSLGNLLTSLLRKCIRNKVDKKYEKIGFTYFNDFDHFSIEEFLAAKCDNLLKLLREKISRARIARGAFTNILISFIPLILLGKQWQNILLLTWFIATLLTLLIWKRWQEISFKSEIICKHLCREKILPCNQTSKKTQ